MLPEPGIRQFDTDHSKAQAKFMLWAFVVARGCHENLDKASDNDSDDANLDNDHGDPYPGERDIRQVGRGC